MNTQTNTQTNMKPLVLIRDKNEIFYQRSKNFLHVQESMMEKNCS